MKKIITAAVLLALVVSLAVTFTACSNTSDEYAPPAGMINASVAEANFYLYVPDKWTVDNSAISAGAYYNKADPSSVSLMRGDLDAETLSAENPLDAWWDKNKTELSEVFSDFNVESEDNLLIDSAAGKKYVYTASIAGDSYKFMQAAVIKKEDVYIFTYSSTPENFDSHLDEVSEMIEHIIIK